MQGLWDTASIQPRRDIVVPGETVSAVFWKAAAQRADRVFMRQKELGLWREWTWARTAAAVREVGDGLLALGLRRCAAPRGGAADLGAARRPAVHRHVFFFFQRRSPRAPACFMPR